MTRDSRIARPQFRQSPNLQQRVWVRSALLLHADVQSLPALRENEFAAQGGCWIFDSIESRANTSILSGSGNVSPELFQDFYHRSLRLPAPEVGMANPTRSIIR